MLPFRGFCRWRTLTVGAVANNRRGNDYPRLKTRGAAQARAVKHAFPERSKSRGKNERVQERNASKCKRQKKRPSIYSADKPFYFHNGDPLENARRTLRSALGHETKVALLLYVALAGRQ